MQDDFTVFWRNNERASALFYDLLERSERGAYDDDFLMQLATYCEHRSRSVRISLPHAICLRRMMRRRRASVPSAAIAAVP